MSISRKSFLDERRDLKSAILHKLESSIEDGQALEEVETIIYGERYRINDLETPAVWVVPSPYIPEKRGGHKTDHDFSYDFVAMVQSETPEEGLDESQELAAKVYDLMMDDRTLNGTVMDVVPSLVHPAYSVGDTNDIYWSAIQLTYKVIREE